jgi:hypothetical protein
MLESEMSAQEKAVTEKVTQHLQQQYGPLETKVLFVLSHFFDGRFQQEFERISQQHAADMAQQKQAHEAEMAAAYAREEANLAQVTTILLALLKSKPEIFTSLYRSCSIMHKRGRRRRTTCSKNCRRHRTTCSENCRHKTKYAALLSLEADDCLRISRRTSFRSWVIFLRR